MFKSHKILNFGGRYDPLLCLLFKNTLARRKILKCQNWKFCLQIGELHIFVIYKIWVQIVLYEYGPKFRL